MHIVITRPKEDSFYLIQGGPPDKSTPENPWYIFW